MTAPPNASTGGRDTETGEYGVRSAHRRDDESDDRDHEEDPGPSGPAAGKDLRDAPEMLEGLRGQPQRIPAEVDEGALLEPEPPQRPIVVRAGDCSEIDHGAGGLGCDGPGPHPQVGTTVQQEDDTRGAAGDERERAERRDDQRADGPADGRRQAPLSSGQLCDDHGQQQHDRAGRPCRTSHGARRECASS